MIVLACATARNVPRSGAAGRARAGAVSAAGGALPAPDPDITDFLVCVCVHRTSNRDSAGTM